MKNSSEVGRMLAAKMLMCVLMGVLMLAARVAVGAQDQPVHRIRIGANVQEAKMIKREPLVYPAAAVQGKIQGTVYLDAVINKDGSVKKVRSLSGPQELADSAIEAVRQWQYQPTLLQGGPVEIETTITLIYKLNKSGEGKVLNGIEALPRLVAPPRVRENDQEAKLIKKVPPVYPEEAKKSGISGTVVLRVIIAMDGGVKEARYVSGPRELMNAAIKAALQWEYQPTLIKGKPVEVDSTVGVVFTLDQ